MQMLAFDTFKTGCPSLLWLHNMKSVTLMRKDLLFDGSALCPLRTRRASLPLPNILTSGDLSECRHVHILPCHDSNRMQCRTRNAPGIAPELSEPRDREMGCRRRRGLPASWNARGQPACAAALTHGIHGQGQPSHCPRDAQVRGTAEARRICPWWMH